jgi:hypothetical protein
MSKNIYRVNKKSDLDEIIKNNFYKPICLVFLSKSADTKMYNDITVSLLAISKEQPYNMIIIIDFDDFIDNINYFSSIKNNIPYFISYFKGKTINMCDDKDNFIPLVINHLEKIHTSYINKLINVFNQTNDNPGLGKIEEKDEKVIKNQEIKQNNGTEEIQGEDKDKDKDVDVDVDEDEGEDEGEDVDKEEDEDEDEEEEEEEEKEVKEDKKVEEVEDNKYKDDNDTKYINKEKEKIKKLKELKKLREMLEK